MKDYIISAAEYFILLDQIARAFEDGYDAGFKIAQEDSFVGDPEDEEEEDYYTAEANALYEADARTK